MTLIHLFPGQGSHRVGMGRELFDRYPHLIRQADEVLGYSVPQLCREGPAERLSDTRYTQSAVYVVDALTYVDRVRTDGAIPDVVAGHSLGEYAALFAAGAFDFVTGLEIVQRRADLMADAGPGAMAAVIGLHVEDVRAVIEREGAPVDIANLNAPAQVVVAGPVEAVEAISRTLAEPAEAVVRLKVSGAFHSRYMRPAAEAFEPFLRRYRFGPLKLAVIANSTAGRYEGHRLVETLCEHLVRPVRWSETMAYLLGLPSPDFEEVGPGHVLTGLLAQNRDAAVGASAR